MQMWKMKKKTYLTTLQQYLAMDRDLALRGQELTLKNKYNGKGMLTNNTRQPSINNIPALRTPARRKRDNK